MFFFLNGEENLPSTGGQFRIFSSLFDALLRLSTLEFRAHVARPVSYAQTIYEYRSTFLLDALLQICQDFVRHPKSVLDNTPYLLVPQIWFVSTVAKRVAPPVSKANRLR